MTPPPTRRRLTGLLVLAGMGAGLLGCGSASPGGSAASTDGPTASASSLTSSATAGPATAPTVTSSPVTSSPVPTVVETTLDGQPTLVVPFGAGEPRVAALPVGTTPVPTGDGGLAALDSGGALVIGWDGPGTGSQLLAAGGSVLLQPGAEAVSPARIPVVTGLIEQVRWTTAAGRPRLEVTANRWGRTWRTPELIHAAWLQVVAEQPDADTAGMENQYRCHAEWAPGKTLFHLEPWRPADDYATVVLSGCNPGGEEPP